MSSVLGTPAAEAPYHILDSLAAVGWAIAIVAAPKGIKVTATFGVLEVEAEGRELADVALVLAAACTRRVRHVGADAVAESA